MPDLVSLLDRTTPDDLPPLDRCDQIGLARRARHRTRRQRAGTSAAVLVVVVALAAATVVTIQDPGDRGGEVEATWAGPGGEPLDEPVGSWTRAEDPPFSPRSEVFSGTLSDGRVLVWGGQDEEGFASDGGIYDPSTGEWEAIPSAPLWPEPTVGTSGEVRLTEDRLAILSTDVRRPRQQASVVVYDVERSEWLEAPIVDFGDHPIGFVGVAWDGETMAVLPQPVGADVHYEATTWRWTLGDDTWQQGAPSPLGLRTGMGAAFDGRRLAMWSGSVSGRLQADGAIYDVPTDRWELIPGAPISGGEHPLVTWFGGRVVVSPSAINAPVPEEQFEDVGDLALYDPVTGLWDTRPRSPDFTAGNRAPYLTSDGTAYMPPSRGWFGQASGHSRYLVFTESLSPLVDEPAWFLQSGEWERAPYAGIFRLGAFTVAVGGLDSFESCCPEPAETRIEVRVGSGEWLEAVDAPFAPRRYETVVASGDKMLVIGGLVPDDEAGTSEEPTADTWVFDLAG